MDSHGESITPKVTRKQEGQTQPRGVKLNIGMVGSADVGKTSLIQRFVYGDKFNVKSKIPTIGVDQFPLQV